MAVHTDASRAWRSAGSPVPSPPAGEHNNLFSQSELLLAKIALASPINNRNAPSCLRHPRLAEQLPELLFLVHATSRASVPLMEAAARICRELESGDALAAQLAPYYEEHIDEERHHDEWFLDDMEALGMSRTEVLRRMPPVGIAEAVGAQYYWVLHYHPVALIGYLMALEGDPTPVTEVDAAIARTALPAEAFRTLRLHCQHDIEHFEALCRKVDSLPLEPHHVAVMGMSAIQISGAYDHAFHSIIG